MCGIIGYVGHRPAEPIVMEGLERLEYRGYDSAGIAWLDRNQMHIVRAAGKLKELAEKLAKMPPILATCAMGHTRWATHGAPVERNAHPHRSRNGSLAIVHNGIIENYRELKSELVSQGYDFYSDTDTEILINLVESCQKTSPDLLHAFATALKRAHGAYAVCMISAEEPGVLYAARMAAPLILGLGEGEEFIASDIPAFLPYTNEVVFLEDGEMVRADADGWEILNLETMKPVSREKRQIHWNLQAAQKDGYKHFMLKEIFEQPRVVKDGMTGKVAENLDRPLLPELDAMPIPERLKIVACGTSYHAGLWGARLLEKFAHIPTEAHIASEYRYKDVLLSQPGDMALFISQSGETADTLAALKITKKNGVPTIGLCNVVGSSIAREADVPIYTQAGPEISVASTKAMTSQMLSLLLLALYWGQRKGTLPDAQVRETLLKLQTLPSILDDNLPEMRKIAKELAHKYSGAKNFFFLGRGVNYPLALEGALKLKELSYIHAEGYASGEMKHGPIALIDPAFPTFVLIMNDPLLDKVKSNMVEVGSRGGPIIALTSPGVELEASDVWVVPDLGEILSSFLTLPAMQLFSYEVADYLGKDVDQPRNLAKSVTVE